jgi:hypothetical protein
MRKTLTAVLLGTTLLTSGCGKREQKAGSAHELTAIAVDDHRADQPAPHP